MDDLIFKVPSFVKNASAADTAMDAPEAVLVGSGLRIDTRAAAWNAGATLRKKALKGEYVNPLYKERVDKACDLFGIGDKDYQLNPIECDHIVVKTASHAAEFFVTDAEKLNESAHELLIKRASYPLPFCRECANRLLDCAESHGFEMDPQDRTDLLRLAGTAHFNKTAAAAEIVKRAEYAVNHLSKDYADTMYKLASLVDKVDENSSGILTNTITDAVDLFDKHFNLHHKLASEGMSRIEDVAYLTAEEALQKSASNPVAVDDTHTIPQGRLMVESTRQQMAKWASMQGYSTSAEAEDILDCVATMPESLRADFCEIFA